MKRYVLLAVILGCLGLLVAQTTIEKIDVSFDNPVVTRVAIAVSAKSDWTYTVDKDYHLLYITVKNCTPGSPIVSGLNKNNLIKDINFIESTINGLVVLTLDKPFYIETMTVDNPFKIVVDLFVYKQAYSYKDLLDQAAFYEKSRKWNAANKQYSKMLQQYPKNSDTYYYWGNLLVRQGRIESAIEKLSMVPQSSQFFQAAQKVLAKLTGNELPVAETNIRESDAQESSVSDTLISTVESSPVVEKPLKRKRFSYNFNIFNLKNLFGNWNIGAIFSGIYAWIMSMPIWFWIIILVVLLIIVLIIIDLHRNKKLGRRVRIQKNKIYADDSIKQGMIVKLLEHGWQENEIARELQISLKEVRLYFKKIKKDKARKVEISD